MICPKCGKEMPQGARECPLCAAAAKTASKDSTPGAGLARISTPAILSLTIGIAATMESALSVISRLTYLIDRLIHFRDYKLGFPYYLSNTLPILAIEIFGILGLILGIVALRSISRSKGQIQSKSLALSGIGTNIAAIILGLLASLMVLITFLTSL